MAAGSHALERRSAARVAALFAAGLAISLVMLARCQVARDALSLLTRGWLLAEQGIWVPVGNLAASTTGGFLPGGLTALLVGAPLLVWQDHRAPVVLVLASHVLAYVLLDRLVGRTCGRRARVLFAVLYWLSPWRLYQSAWLDNSNYVFLPSCITAPSCSCSPRRCSGYAATGSRTGEASGWASPSRSPR